MASKISDHLEAMWTHIATLKGDSPDSAFEKYGSFFAPDGEFYSRGPAAPPAVGREAIAGAIKGLLTFWALLDRTVVTRAVDEERKVVATSMSNRLRIAGTVVEGFMECEIVSFSEDGLIKKYELFSDPSPLLPLLPKQEEA
jgi:hypothetical protein